ncbi:MAG: T9SS type A sorting domain-containing protein [Bacteroidetes bacterium]|nr:T9SS type A sorting domain-containing protein [Bacteroidota bacterium]
MKYFYLLFFCFCTHFAQSQTILSLNAQPSQPTSSDPVKIVITNSFPSGGCSLIHEQHSVNGSDITLFVYHCLGPLTYICNISDTIDLGYLPIGTYNLQTNLMTGNTGVNGNCSSFTQTDQYNLNLNVTQSTGIAEIFSGKSQLILDQASGNCFFRSPETASSNIELMDLTGKQVYSTIAVPGKLNIPTNLRSGLYIYSIRSANRAVSTGKIVIN